MIRQNTEFKVYLGTTEYGEKLYLTGFKWDCGWYWGGGYLSTKGMHTHFDGCFLNTVDVRGHSLGSFVSPWDPNAGKDGYKTMSNGAAVWCDLDFFVNGAQFNTSEWWRIKDLYKQFYSLRQAAETFQSGGKCTSDGRNEKEIDKPMADKINDHIQSVIIPEIMKALRLTEEPVRKRNVKCERCKRVITPVIKGEKLCAPCNKELRS